LREISFLFADWFLTVKQDIIFVAKMLIFAANFAMACIELFKK